MIPSQITSDLATFSASVRGAAPLASATALEKASLVTFGNGLVKSIDKALASSVGDLDSTDPIGYAGNLVGYLSGLATSAFDQASLSDLRGTVGRAVFNVGQH